MAMKECLRNLQPVQIYFVLFLTVAFVIFEIVSVYFTHSLTLLINAYHMVCNIIALIGCVASIKYGNQVKSKSRRDFIEEENSASIQVSNQSSSDKKMKNTFGWARIDIMTLLVCCVFLASFSFSLVLQAIQKLIHMSHLDEMHNPPLVFSLGVGGIILNIFCYIIIGGYTFYQAFFLHITKEGDVVLDKSVTSANQAGESQLTAPTRRSPIIVSERQGFQDFFRDIIGCFFIIITSTIVYYTDAGIAKFVDPILAIISAVFLFVLSCPHLKESCMILLQTIPNHINIDSLKQALIREFPGIVNVHDFHVWHLAGSNVVATVHIIFFDKTIYITEIQKVSEFFAEMGITHVTIQPEFHHTIAGEEDCLIRCRGNGCVQSQCCKAEEILNGVITGQVTEKEPQNINKKFINKEIIPSTLDVGLKKFTQLNGDNNTIKKTSKSSEDNNCNCSITVHENKCDDSTAKDLNNCQKNNNDEPMVGDETPCSTMAF